MLDAIQSNVLEILVTLFTVIITYVATKLKKKFEEYINTDAKQKIVKMVVNATEQLYKNLDGEQKLIKAKENIIALIKEKGLSITELEMDMMIEEVVNNFNQILKKDGK
mgnify:FL=1